MNKTNQIAEGITNLNLLSQRMLAHSINTSFTKTLPQLKFLIQKENLKFHYPLPVLERCSYYLSEKGVSLNALQQSLKDVKIRSSTIDEQRIHSNCYFYVKDFSIENMNTLIGKAHEYDVFNNISTVMGDYEQLDVRSLYFDNKQSLKIGSTFRDEHKFKQYNAIVSQFITSNISGIDVSPIQLLKLFYKVSKNQFWEQIVRIFDGVFYQDPEIIIKQKIINNSLRILEDDFNKKLPINDIRSLEMYIKGQLIDKLVYGRNYVHFDKNGMPIWAIVYTLLRAGRIADIKNFLSTTGDKKFSSDFNSYVSNENKLYKIGDEVKDVFLQAIYSIFNRKSQIAFEIISNQKDYLWFALKTVQLNNKISDPDTFTLQQLQNQISQRFDNYPSRENFINLIFVLAFDKVLKPNNFFDSDDIGHFILFLYILRLDQSGFSNQNIREQFYQKMTNYSQQLIRINMSTGLDYLILCYNKKSFPNSKVLSAISDLLIYTNSVQIFFGQRPSVDTLLQDRVIKAILPTKQQYQNFIFQTMDAYSNRSKNYLYPAKVYEYVMNNSNRSIEYLLDILAKQITGQKIFQNSDLKQAIKLIQQMKNPKYSRIFQFIQLAYYLKDVLKSNKQVDERVFSNKYFPNKSTLSLESQQILMDLNRAEYLQVYAMFIFYSLKIIEKYYSFKTNKTREYLETLNYLKRHCREMKNSGVFKESSILFKQKFSQIQRQLQSIKL